MWSSILSISRIVATLLIFIYHALGLMKMPNNHLDTAAVTVFCFLTGFLVGKTNDIDWLKRRVLGILLPYWIVIIPVLVANKLTGYKDVTLAQEVVTLIGGNLFLDNPVYVIAWYVTFVLILYCIVYLQSNVNSFLMRAIVWCSGFGLFYFHLGIWQFYIVFAVGFVLQNIVSPPRKVEGLLFVVQGKCYNFFLIHGGVMVGLLYFHDLSLSSLILFSFILSCTGSLLLEALVIKIKKSAMYKNVAFLH